MAVALEHGVDRRAALMRFAVGVPVVDPVLEPQLPGERRQPGVGRRAVRHEQLRDRRLVLEPAHPCLQCSERVLVHVSATPPRRSSSAAAPRTTVGPRRNPTVPGAGSSTLVVAAARHPGRPRSCTAGRRAWRGAAATSSRTRTSRRPRDPRRREQRRVVVGVQPLQPRGRHRPRRAPRRSPRPRDAGGTAPPRARPTPGAHAYQRNNAGMRSCNDGRTSGDRPISASRGPRSMKSSWVCWTGSPTR